MKLPARAGFRFARRTALVGLALVLVRAPGLYAWAPPPGRPCSQRDSVGLLSRADPAFPDAQAFRRFLSQHGFVVSCVIRSIFASFLWSAPEAAFLTDRGDIEVRFFPPPDGAESVQIEEQRSGSVWRYTFPPHAGASDTMYASRQYFIKSRRWLIMVDDPAVAHVLRKALAVPENERGYLPRMRSSY